MQLIVPSLGYLGFIPFAVAVYLALSDRALLDQDPGFLFISYSAIILSFMGGALWGRVLLLEDGAISRYLLIISNLIALLAWVGLSMGSEVYVVSLALLMLGYTALLFIEQHCFQTVMQDVDPEYMNLRFVLTGLVLIAHLALILFS